MKSVVTALGTLPTDVSLIKAPSSPGFSQKHNPGGSGWLRPWSIFDEVKKNLANKMRKQMNVLVILLLILSTNVAFGDGNKTKLTKITHHTTIKGKANDRIKRSPNYNNNDKQFWTNRGKRQITNKDSSNTDIDMDANRKFLLLESKMKNEPPFWGNRGRRSSEENYNDFPYADVFSVNNDLFNLKPVQKLNNYPSSKDRREDFVPFWGNRGRRSSDEIPDDNENAGPFWSSRGKRQEEEPFWGTRGRRGNNFSFWGNKDSKDEEPFWGNRGRRQDNEPFWGNRGRRQDDDPFWGNRGKKEDPEPFWGNRGKKKMDDFETFFENRGRRKEDLKESIIEAISKVEHDIDNLSRLKRGPQSGLFWSNRGRDSQLKHLFERTRIKNQQIAGPFKSSFPYELSAKPSQSSTVIDDRIYVDEPHYIVLERSGRSSAELDPFFISRGKKKKLYKTSRGRRGAIEEIVKSVRNDPFYIARGKKDVNDNQTTNATKHDEFLKAKELICATVGLMFMKNEGLKFKREIKENERDRRNILKKLAAQLQNDPYFVSRGKKNEIQDNYIEEFVNQVAATCN